MSFIKYIYFIFFIIIVNCSGNKVANYHGTKSLEKKFDQIRVNYTNKNDLFSIFGPPSTVSDFNKNKWIYFERIKTNQSLVKLGAQKIEKNNILIVEINENGLLKEKKLLDLNNMNDIKYLKNTTNKEFTKSDNMLYGVFSSLREKINAPLRNRKK